MTTLGTLEARFEGAETAAEYSDIRQRVREWAGPERLQAAVLATDCSFFICLPERKGANPENVAELLNDLAEALRLLAEDPSSASLLTLNRLASLANDVCVMGNFGRRAGWSDARLWATIANAIEAGLPDSFEFSSSVFGAEARTRTVKGACNFAALSFLCGRPEFGARRCRRLLEAAAAAGDPVDHFVIAFRLRDLAAECLLFNPQLFPAVLELYSLIASHVDRFRARRRSRAGRLLIAQLFSGLLDHLFVDLAEAPIPEEWHNRGAAADAFFDVLRDYLFAISEHGRSRLLLDEMLTPFLPFASDSASAEATAIERPLLALPAPMKGVELELRLVARLPTVIWQDPRQHPKAEAQYRERLHDVEALEALLISDDAGFIDTGHIADLADIRAALGPDEALLTYALPRETLHPARRICIIAVTSKAIRHVIVDLEFLKEVPGLYRGDIGAMSVGGKEPLEVSPLAELVVWTRAAIRADNPEVAPALRLLDIILVQPLAQIGITPQAFRHWFVVASGLLHAIPFGAALSASGVYLAQSVALSFPPSASAWLALRTQWTPPLRFVGLANPDLDRVRWPALKSAESEIKSAAKRLGNVSSRLYFGLDATMGALQREASDASIIHVATHGEFPESDVINLHQFLLTATEGDDGIVLAERLRLLPLGKTQLLVLSICNGALLRFGPGEELHGLMSAALGAGVANLVTSLWPIDDGMAAVWMQSFYKHLVKEGPAFAARQAVCDLVGDGASVRDWAPFMVVGATQRPEL